MAAADYFPAALRAFPSRDKIAALSHQGPRSARAAEPSCPWASVARRPRGSRSP